MKILHFTSSKLVFCFILGIIFGYYIDIGIKVLFIVFFLCVTILGGLQAIRATFFSPVLSGSITLVSIFLMGALNLSIHQEEHHPNHYTKKTDITVENPVVFEIRKALKPNAFYNRYEVEILAINHQNASGKVLVNLRRDSTALSTMHIDDRYVAKVLLKTVNSPLNPHQFNYKNYLKKRQIYHQVYLAPKAYYALSSNDPPSLYHIAFGIRKKINDALQHYGFTSDTLGIINALLLGQRQGISDEVYRSYTNAGAIHILAVSGLHVGIILFIFHLILKPLERFRYGKNIKLFLIMLGLWMFAGLAGLSPSVVRAVTMFSFIAWAIHLKRSTNSYNILAISMFTLLLFKPYFLFDVGFQLSYIAVFAIVWIQPMLYALWNPPYKSIDFFWKLFTVTLAAQCGVAPLSLYYFHQFPGLFFVSNLVIIPILGVILGFGILIVILALCNNLPHFLGNGYAFVIDMMNRFVGWIAQQEAFLIQHIPFDEKLLFATYMCIILGVLALQKLLFSRIVAVLMAILLLQGVCVFTKYTTENTHKTIIFHQYANSILGLQQGTTLKLYSNDKKWENRPIISHYTTAEWIKKVNTSPLKNIYTVHDKVLLRVDASGIYKIPGLHPDYILLCDMPKINLERLITELHPKIIIADGSNSIANIQRWKATCAQYHVPFHATRENGAFIF